eukprot:gene11932-13902_t
MMDSKVADREIAKQLNLVTPILAKSKPLLFIINKENPLESKSDVLRLLSKTLGDLLNDILIATITSPTRLKTFHPLLLPLLTSLPNQSITWIRSLDAVDSAATKKYLDDYGQNTTRYLLNYLNNETMVAMWQTPLFAQVDLMCEIMGGVEEIVRLLHFVSVLLSKANENDRALDYLERSYRMGACLDAPKRLQQAYRLLRLFSKCGRHDKSLAYTSDAILCFVEANATNATALYAPNTPYAPPDDERNISLYTLLRSYIRSQASLFAQDSRATLKHLLPDTVANVPLETRIHIYDAALTTYASIGAPQLLVLATIERILLQVPADNHPIIAAKYLIERARLSRASADLDAADSLLSGDLADDSAFSDTLANERAKAAFWRAIAVVEKQQNGATTGTLLDGLRCVEQSDTLDVVESDGSSSIARSIEAGRHAYRAPVGAARDLVGAHLAHAVGLWCGLARLLCKPKTPSDHANNARHFIGAHATISILFSAADLYTLEGDLPAAILVLKLALTLLKCIYSGESPYFIGEAVRAYTQLTSLYISLERWDLARAYLSAGQDLLGEAGAQFSGLALHTQVHALDLAFHAARGADSEATDSDCESILALHEDCKSRLKESHKLVDYPVFIRLTKLASLVHMARANSNMAYKISNDMLDFVQSLVPPEARPAAPSSAAKEERIAQAYAARISKWGCLHICIDALLHIASIHELRGRPKEAHYYYERGLLIGNIYGSLKVTCEFLVELGELCFNRHNYTDSKINLEHAITLMDTHAPNEPKLQKTHLIATMLLGDLFRRQSIVSQSTKLYKKCLSTIDSYSSSDLVERFRNSLTFKNDSTPKEKRLLKLTTTRGKKGTSATAPDKSNHLDIEQIIDSLSETPNHVQSVEEVERTLASIRARIVGKMAKILIVQERFDEAIESLEQLISDTENIGSITLAILQFHLGRAYFLSTSDECREDLWAHFMLPKFIKPHKNIIKARNIFLEAFATATEMAEKSALFAWNGGVEIPAKLDDATFTNALIAIYSDLPTEWSLCNIIIGIDRKSMVLTKMTGDLQPVLIKIRMPTYQVEYESTSKKQVEQEEDDEEEEEEDEEEEEEDNLKNNDENTPAKVKGDEADMVKHKWYQRRRNLESEVDKLCNSLSSVFGPWKGVFIGSLAKGTLDDSMQENMETLLVDLTTVQKDKKRQVCPGLLHCLLIALPYIDEAQLHQAVIDLMGFAQPTDIHSSEDDYLETLASGHPEWKKIKKSKDLIVKAYIDSFSSNKTLLIQEANEIIKGSTRLPVVLMLDKNLQLFPIEALEALREASVYRLPSFAIHQLLTMKNRVAYRRNQTKVDAKSLSFILNPKGDLVQTEKTFSKLLHSVSNGLWQGVQGRNPSATEYRQALEENDLFLYMGHGSGEQYYPGSDIQKLTKCAVSILFGCRSGNLEEQGEYEPHGVILDLLLAGSSAVIGHLWDIPSMDSDRLAQTFVQKWFEENRNKTPGSDNTDISMAISFARKSCQWKLLVGSSCICYGIPTYLKPYK